MSENSSTESPRVQPQSAETNTGIQEPVVGSGAPKKRTWIMVLLSITLIGFLMSGAYYLGTQQRESSENQQDSNIQCKTDDQISPSDFQTQSPQETDTIPKPNTLYLGTYEGKVVAFYTNDILRTFTTRYDPVSAISPYIGFMFEKNGYSVEGFDFRDLDQPRRVYRVIMNPEAKANTFVTDESNKYVYFSLLNDPPEGKRYEELTNEVVRVSLDDLSATTVWTHKVYENDKYPEAKGLVELRRAAGDRYVAMAIKKCYQCVSYDVGTIILNTITNNEKYLQNISAVEFDVQNKTFTYQKLKPYEVGSCGPVGECINGKKIMRVPEGRFITDVLP